MAGCPVASNGQVFASMLSAASTYSSREQSGSGSLVASIGSVGIASTSYSASAAS